MVLSNGTYGQPRFWAQSNVPAGCPCVLLGTGRLVTPVLPPLGHTTNLSHRPLLKHWQWLCCLNRRVLRPLRRHPPSSPLPPCGVHPPSAPQTSSCPREPAPQPPALGTALPRPDSRHPGPGPLCPRPPDAVLWTQPDALSPEGDPPAASQSTTIKSLRAAGQVPVLAGPVAYVPPRSLGQALPPGSHSVP